MIQKVFYGLFCLVLAIIGLILCATTIQPLLADQPSYVYYAVAIWTVMLMFSLGVVFFPIIIRSLEKLVNSTVSSVTIMDGAEIISVAIGLILGLVIASLFGSALARVQVVGPYLAILTVLLLSYIGGLVGYRKREDFAAMFHTRPPKLLAEARLESPEEERRTEKAERADKAEKNEKTEKSSLFGKKDKAKSWQARPKVLDTSVIIDGRILDVYRSGFLEGDLVVPEFVLDELRHIADSNDSLRRTRGRGGLDCLNTMQDEYGEAIVITDADYPEVAEVDSKLLKLAQSLRGAVITNDYNLNKVATLQGVPVLNINELANAVKPVAIPGEELTATVIKEGKEPGQGVAYLDDGTMIVVENGRRFIGDRLQLVVTSILQTAAGRMVFARPKFGKDGNPIKLS